MSNLGEALLSRCRLASFPCGEHEFSESASVLSEVEWWPGTSFCWIRGCCVLTFPLGWVSTWRSFTSTFYSWNASDNKQWQRLTPRDASRTTRSEEIVGDKESSAAKGFYFPFPACFMFKYCLYGGEKKASDILSVCALFFKSRWF